MVAVPVCSEQSAVKQSMPPRMPRGIVFGFVLLAQLVLADHFEPKKSSSFWDLKV